MEKRMKALKKDEETIKQYKHEYLMNVMAEKVYIQQGQAVTKKALIDIMRKNRVEGCI